MKSFALISVTSAHNPLVLRISWRGKKWSSISDVFKTSQVLYYHQIKKNIEEFFWISQISRCTLASLLWMVRRQWHMDFSLCRCQELNAAHRDVVEKAFGLFAEIQVNLCFLHVLFHETFRFSKDINGTLNSGGGGNRLWVLVGSQWILRASSPVAW